jgi:competence protein ComEC
VNVGQGDAILIKSGGADVLVDGGPQGSARRVVATMRALGIRDLDTIVVTHAHADHAGATDELARNYDPERVLVAGRCDGQVARAARAAGARVLQTRAGNVYRWGAVSVRVLSPGRLAGDANADSLVLLLEVAGRRILLTGDLTGPNEDRVARSCARGPDLYALKVAHHGSRFSTSATFLAATEPRIAVVSAGENSYGHPAWQTLRRLHRAGARIYTTRRNGTATLTVSPSGAVEWRFAETARPLRVRL